MVGVHDFVDPEDMRAIMQLVDPRFQALLQFLLQTGMRISEALALGPHSFTGEVDCVCLSCKITVEDPKLKQCPKCGTNLVVLVKIIKRYQRQRLDKKFHIKSLRGKQVIRGPKRGSVGDSWISEQLAERIRAIKTKAIVIDVEEEDDKFVKREMQLYFPFSRQNAWQRIQRTLRRANIDKSISPHDFRATMTDKVTELSPPGSSLPSEVIHHRSQRALDKSLDGYRRRHRDKAAKVPVIASYVQEVERAENP